MGQGWLTQPLAQMIQMHDLQRCRLASLHVNWFRSSSPCPGYQANGVNVSLLIVETSLFLLFYFTSAVQLKASPRRTHGEMRGSRTRKRHGGGGSCLERPWMFPLRKSSCQTSPSIIDKVSHGGSKGKGAVLRRGQCRCSVPVYALGIVLYDKAHTPRSSFQGCFHYSCLSVKLPCCQGERLHH